MNLFKAIILLTLLIVVFTVTGVIIYLSRNLDTLEIANNDATALPIALVAEEPSENNAAQTLNLSISPKSQALRVGQTFSVYVTAQSPREILAIDLYLIYNPQALRLVSIEPGSYFPNPIVAKNAHDANTGSILYSLASLTPTAMTGNLAKLTFAVKPGSAQTTISIHPDTLASLKGAVKAQNSIQNGAFLIQ